MENFMTERSEDMQTSREIDWTDDEAVVKAARPDEELSAEDWRGGYLVCDVKRNGWPAVNANAYGHTKKRAWATLREVDEVTQAFERLHNPSLKPPAPAVQTKEADQAYDPANAVIHACGLLDVIKQEWGSAWTEHDQKTRNGLSAAVSILTPPAPAEETRLPERPKWQGGDYRPHYRKRYADAYMDHLESLIKNSPQTQLATEKHYRKLAAEEVIHWRAIADQAIAERDRYKSFGDEFIWGEDNPNEYESELSKANARAEAAEAKLAEQAKVRQLLADSLNFILPCNSQDPDMHEDECPEGHEFECGTCEHRHSVQRLLSTPSVAAEPEETNEDTTDVRMVRPVGGSVLGSEEADLVPLPITDDRDLDYIDPRLRGSADLIVKSALGAVSTILGSISSIPPAKEPS